MQAVLLRASYLCKYMRSLRNADDRLDLIGRIRKLSPDDRPLWGRMNAGQMISHLVQASELPFVASVPDVSNVISRTLIKPLVLYVLAMPKEVKTSAEIDQQQSGRKPQDFSSDRDLLIDSIDRLGKLSLDHKCLGHPFFGEMTAKQWAVLAYKHTDHHLRQFGV
jgi:hypothetical protein